ncbi:hypothetical protein K0M31_012827 [Melipona bicolor]|uniref:Uncharacterized protein n=1 Tax=Melipona bicolor TaxID=60889 RepID=A0AA40KH34_9HYME|nr:hypothetical protein K0M31_012827 [Melipona bicolor]
MEHVKKKKKLTVARGIRASKPGTKGIVEWVIIRHRLTVTASKWLDRPAQSKIRLVQRRQKKRPRKTPIMISENELDSSDSLPPSSNKKSKSLLTDEETAAELRDIPNINLVAMILQGAKIAKKPPQRNPQAISPQRGWEHTFQRLGAIKEERLGGK